ncbi:methionyl-tRNA formyltransferase [Micavibrio aeruginosavorus]|uniref:Bifunctional polymyxin resistance ArnA protein n=1 Tax=Micavibrio aeruginosavorus EPB TaxID=349215 RepID=M4VEY7_9BACT|nr:methionyl-tRNA formyltransferase [Micavibrio aeruginosavorus]AGH97793.1 bifunctional polymyxin resistance ArnA protein [Micavibrio aeruginosavorus EPB]
MNVVFIGSSKFGQRCLLSLLGMADVRVSGVVTAPKKFTISYNKDGVENVLHADVSDICRAHYIPFIEISDGMKGDDLFEKVSEWKPDMFLVCGWYHMVPKRWRDMAPAYGLHASLLPDYSGGAPLVWAIINGEKQAGITMFRFDDGVDSGPIVGQVKTPIYHEDTIATLYTRIEDLGLALVVEHVPTLANGTAKMIVQNESLRRLFPQRSPEDGKIDWSRSAREVYDFVRAQTKPYPGAFSVIKDRKLTVWAVVESDLSDVGTQGIAVISGHQLFVGCGDGKIVEVKSVAIDDVDCSVADAVDLIKPECFLA